MASDRDDTLHNILPFEGTPAFSAWCGGRRNSIDARSLPRLVAFTNAALALRAHAVAIETDHLYRLGMVAAPMVDRVELKYRGYLFRLFLVPGAVVGEDSPALALAQVVRAEWTFKKPKLRRICPKRGPRKVAIESTTGATP